MSKLDKLLSIRLRTIGDFDHHNEELKKFTATSSVTAISYRMIAFEKTYKEFVDVTEELEKVAAFHEHDQYAAVIAANRKVLDKYLEAKLFVSQLLPDDEVNTSLNSSFFPQLPRCYAETTENQAQSNPNKGLGLKLPSIQLTPFDGKHEKWPEFKDLFLSIMKKYKGDDVEKLTHLRNFLRGEALETIAYLGVKNGSYETALEVLTKTYESKDAIIDAHLRNFVDLPQITDAVPSSIRQAITTTQTCLASISSFEIMTETWDTIIVFLLKDKFSHDIRNKWEEERKSSHEPATKKELLDFLDIRYRISLRAATRKPPSKPNTDTKRNVKTFTLTDGENSFVKNDNQRYEDEYHQTEITTDETDESILHNRRTEICGICEEAHRVFTCPKLTQNAADALQLVKDKGLCTNCLYKHDVTTCTSKFTCKKCQTKHHTLLHDAFQDANFHTLSVNHADNIAIHRKHALLATALVPIYSNGGFINLRALIDPGSTANLLSERGAQLIRCTRQRIIGVPMFGVCGTQTGMASYKTTIQLSSLHQQDLQLSIDTYITNHVTSVRQVSAASASEWTHLKGLQLADPTFLEAGNIDLLIGVDTYAELIESGLIKGQRGQPIAQKTKLGWILSGVYESEEHINLKRLMDLTEEPTPPEDHLRIHMITNEDLATQIKAFWEVEEITPVKHWSEEEQACEDFFVKTTKRADDGKLVMRLPFNMDVNSPNFLGESKERALNRFKDLEKRFARNPTLKVEYAKCINEYIELGHAVEVPMSRYKHIIPHHSVFKESSTTTKCRVVYDASAKTTNGFSLNNRLPIGPPILEDIWSYYDGVSAKLQLLPI